MGVVIAAAAGAAAPLEEPPPEPHCHPPEVGRHETGFNGFRLFTWLTQVQCM